MSAGSISYKRKLEMKMKIAILGAAAAAFLFVTGPGSVLAQTDLTDGLVTKIDESAQKITIRHGPMKKFDMEDGMTMVYRVQNPGILKAAKTGDKVKFDAERINGQFTVTKIQKVK